MHIPMWSRNRSDDRDADDIGIEIGAEFACAAPANTTERARVLAIEICEDGIPHVRYACELHRSDRICESGTKTLALPTFKKKFHII